MGAGSHEREGRSGQRWGNGLGPSAHVGRGSTVLSDTSLKL
jgi:hypothetical protein